VQNVPSRSKSTQPPRNRAGYNQTYNIVIDGTALLSQSTGAVELPTSAFAWTWRLRNCLPTIRTSPSQLHFAWAETAMSPNEIVKRAPSNVTVACVPDNVDADADQPCFSSQATARYSGEFLPHRDRCHAHARRDFVFAVAFNSVAHCRVERFGCQR
jgi:hypothetical protein